MSIANVANRWLNRFYQILAIMLVLLAVLISAFRLFLPYVEEYRQQFQDYINTTNQTNIVIGGLGMSWQGSGPIIIASQVTLIDTPESYIYVEHLAAQIDFWATVSTQELISNNLILDGAVVVVKPGKWPKSKVNERNTGFNNIADIFLNRINRFSVINSDIAFEENTIQRNFRINNLNWLNTGDQHQAQGSIIFNELSSNNLKLQIELNGQTIDALKGAMFVDANHLDMSSWLDNIVSVDKNHIKTDMGFSAWLTVNEGNIERLQVSLHDNMVTWQDNTQNSTTEIPLLHTLTLSSGQLLLVKGQQPAHFNIYSTPMSWQINEEPSEEFTLQISKSAQDYGVYLSALDLTLLSQLSPLFIHNPATRTLVSGLNITGKMENVFLQKTTEDMQAVASFSHVSTQYNQGIPGAEDISGELSFSQQSLHLAIAAQQGYLDFNEHFIAPLPYDSLQANVALSFIDNSWKLQVNDITISSEDVTLTADLGVNSPVNEAMTMSLFANVSTGDASKAGHYFPLTLMSDDLDTYLNGAITDGKVTQAQILVNGELVNFPFQDKSGTFIVDAEIEQGSFKFSDDWPIIKNIAANLHFSNESLLITGRAGNLNGLNIKGAQVAIDDLINEQVLTVDSLFQVSSTADITDLMIQSPLKQNVGKTLQQVQIQGDISGEFHLNLPLTALENVVARGKVNLVNNQILLQTPNMNFEQVNGQFSFNNSLISTKNLRMNWQGLPLTLQIKGENKADQYDTHIAMKGKWAQTTWLAHVPPDLKKYLDGELAFQGNLALYQPHNGDLSYQLELGSNLAALALHVPAPYHKIAQLKVPLDVTIKGQLAQSVFNATYGEKLSFFGVLDHDSQHFSSAHIVMGDEKMRMPIEGFHITTNLANANANDWQPFITDILHTAALMNETQDDKRDPPKGLFPVPEDISGKVGTFNVLGQVLHDVSFDLLNQPHWWLLTLNAKETRSQIKIYPDWLEQGIDIKSDFIHLTHNEHIEPASQGEKETVISLEKEHAIFDNFPKMNFNCERCQIDKINFGKVNFSLMRSPENVIIMNHFEATREQAKLTLSGAWQQTVTGSSTTLNGVLSLKNIEYELMQLGYGSIIRDSGGELDFNLAWQGGPHNFDFSHLNGELKANIDDGYLAEVSDKARILSVLSLQSIVRKLTLDFRDIFSDGMFYKNIQGEYQIKAGVLYTDNTRMNGSAGNLFIEGNTSFVDNLLDYKMSYKPNLTSSLPVLAWIATLNPVVFLAGVAIDQVITSKVVSEFNFELTGDLSNPSFKEVNRKSRDVSVGRSKPPEFVDSDDKTKLTSPEKTNNNPVKDFKSPSILKPVQDPFNEDHVEEEL